MLRTGVILDEQRAKEEAEPATRGGKRDAELQSMLDAFDLLGRIRRDTGEQGCERGNRIEFGNCPVCGHRDCFSYYPADKSWHCFGASGSCGGTAIDYLMRVDGLSTKEAVEAIRTELGAPRGHRAMAGGKANRKPPKTNDKDMPRDFAEQFRGSLRWCVEDRCFYAFDGRRWAKDVDGIMARKATKSYVDGLPELAGQLTGDEKAWESYLSNVAGYQSAYKRKALLDDAKCELPASKAIFDRDRWKMNVENGILNLRTGQLAPHDPSEMMTKLAPVRFDPEARCEDWEAFTKTLFDDPETLAYAKRLFGASMIADTSNELFHVFGFASRSGKSTLCNAIAETMGIEDGYAAVTDPSTLMAKPFSSGGANPELAALVGARLVIASEPPEGERLNEAFMKAVTGNDPITTRQLYGGSFTFKPSFNVILLCNSAPRIVDVSVFTSGRVRVVPFEHHVPEGERDTGMKARLSTAKARSAILNWCLSGLRDYLSNGLGKPPAVEAATAEYAANSDKVQQFIDQALEKVNGALLKASEVYAVYKEWCSRNGYAVESRATWNDRFRAKGLYKGKMRIGGKPESGVILGYSMAKHQW